MMPSSATRFFAGSAIDDTESNSLRCFHRLDADADLLRSPEHDQLDVVRRIPEAEVVADRRQVLGGLAVHGHQDVTHRQTGRLRRTAGPDVGHDDAVVSRQSERRGHARRDGLDAHAHFLPAQVTVLPELAEHRPGRRARNGEAQALVPSGLRQDERVDADHFPADVDQRAARIAGIDRRIGLHEDLRRVGVHLPCHGRDQPVGQAVAEPVGAAECKHHLALPDLRVGRQRQRRKFQAVDLQQRQVQFGGDAHDLCGDELRLARTTPSRASRPRCPQGSTIWTRRAPFTTCAFVMM